LIGTIGTQWAISRREKEARTIAFKRQQLSELYGPLLAAHKEIRARSELRVKLQEALDAAHSTAILQAGPANVEAASDTHVPAIFANIEDETQTFRDVLMPRYRSMIDIFRDKMWLAEPETRGQLKHLIEFVDVWDKILTDKLPRSIAPAIGHTEENLAPFYSHLEAVHDRLRNEVG
jgi:hypothetical protein